MSKSKKVDKRYPRGIVYTKKGWSGMCEAIDLGNVGALYSLAGLTKTVFMPYTSIDRIEYEDKPQEVIDAETEAAARERAEETSDE